MPVLTYLPEAVHDIFVIFIAMKELSLKWTHCNLSFPTHFFYMIKAWQVEFFLNNKNVTFDKYSKRILIKPDITI